MPGSPFGSCSALEQALKRFREGHPAPCSSLSSHLQGWLLVQGFGGRFKAFLQCRGGGAGGVEERWRAGASAQHGRQVAQTHSVAKSDIFIGCKQCGGVREDGLDIFEGRGGKGWY